jgi:hypothetical protein
MQDYLYKLKGEQVERLCAVIDKRNEVLKHQSGGTYTDNECLNIGNLNSPMDQFEIKPFLGEFLGLNFTPIGLITNILVYIQLVVVFTYLFYVYATFKDSIRING